MYFHIKIIYYIFAFLETLWVELASQDAVCLVDGDPITPRISFPPGLDYKMYDIKWNSITGCSAVHQNLSDSLRIKQFCIRFW